MLIPHPDRRSVLGGFSLMGASMAFSNAGLGKTHAQSSSRFAPSTPEDHLQALVKLQASLEMEIDIPWWYEGVIYGVVEGQPNRPLYRYEGMEMYWMTQDEEGYTQQGNTLTFFRDYETEDFIYEFQNPYTGKTNQVTPNILGGGKGLKLTTKGPYWIGMKELFPEKPLELRWTQSGDMAWLKSERDFPPGVPLIESQTTYGPVDELVDPNVQSVNALFASTYLAPWPAWMEMEGQPGQVVWHAAGRKLASVDELPDEYLARLKSDHPDKITADPGT